MSFYNPLKQGPDWGQGLQGLFQNIMQAMMMKKMMGGGGQPPTPTLGQTPTPPPNSMAGYQMFGNQAAQNQQDRPYGIDPMTLQMIMRLIQNIGGR